MRQKENFIDENVEIWRNRKKMSTNFAWKSSRSANSVSTKNGGKCFRMVVLVETTGSKPENGKRKKRIWEKTRNRWKQKNGQKFTQEKYFKEETHRHFWTSDFVVAKHDLRFRLGTSLGALWLEIKIHRSHRLENQHSKTIEKMTNIVSLIWKKNYF